MGVIKPLTLEILDAHTASGFTHVSWKLKDPYHFIVSFHKEQVELSMTIAKFRKTYLAKKDFTLDYIVD